MMKLFYERNKPPAREKRKGAEEKESKKIIMPDANLQLIDYIESL